MADSDGETQDPVAWLRAAILERKALAVAAASVAGPASRHGLYWPEDGTAATTMILSAAGSPLADTLHRDDEEMAPHIAANDPQDTIARCEAELAILVEHAPEWADYMAGARIERTSLHCKTCEPPGTPDNYPCCTVRLLLSAYRYRSGYGERWGATIG